MRKTLRAALAALLAFTLLPTASLTAIAGEMGTLAVGDAVALPPQFTLDLSDATYSSEAATRFYVRAESTDGGYLTYQWHRSGGYDAPQAGAGDGGAADAAIKTNPINFAQGEGGTSSVLSAAAPAVEQTTYFYYWVTVTNHRDANGNGTTDELGESTAKDSALACVKVVNRTLEPKLMNGDFQSFNHAWMGTDTGNSSGHWSSPAVDIPADKTIVPYWNTTHDGSYSTEAAQKPVHNGKVMEIQRAGVGGVSQGLSTEGHGPTPNSVIYDQTAGSYPLIVELSAAMKSSIYQDIATVPGKIYEWSIDFAAPSSDNLTEMVAVVIGPALNEESDYQSDVTDHWTGPVTYTLSNGSGNNFKCIQPGTYTWTYPYGVNTDTFFQDIVLAAGVPVAATEAGAANDTLRQSLNGTTYAVPYNGSTYYVKLVSDVGGNGVWTQGAGSYTVPSGQGTTVFGFASVFAKNANGGNLLDNIVFSSGTDLDAKQNLTYAGETSLSAPTQDGFAYALAEIRGSSVNELVGLNATYKPEGGSEVAVAPTPGLGAGWYATHGEGSSFSTGTITFKDLVPGKTYRIIGIPKLAINTGLHTNESPGNVLDEGYYKDVRIQPTFGGSDEDGAQALPAWQVELYTQAGVGARTRVTLLHSNAGSEYALLAGNQDAPYTPATPALAGTAPEGSGWSVGTGSNLAFEGLPVNNSETVYYWLVSRPAGYTEVGYSDAAWPQGQTGPLGALPISVPPNFADDLDAAFVSRSPHGTSITIAAGLGGAQNGYEYALADVQSGRLIGNPIPYIDSAITFNNLQPLLDYQVVRRASNAGWLRGVRVFRAPQNLMVDYVNASVISTAPEATGGFIPADVEYSVRANTGQTPTWLVGGADTWVKATGSERLELAESGVVTAEGFSDTSILGALDALGNATDATVRYRLASVGDYVGPAVLPELELAVPLRPAAPVVGALAGSADFALDWAGEKIKVGPKALEWRADGLGAGTDAAYTPLAAGAEVGFAELGWTGAADRTVVMRFEAFAATDQTPGAFASHDSAPTVLEARPDVPENLYALLKNSEAPEQGIEMRNLIAGRAYQYRYTSESAGSLRQWQELTATGTVATLPFALGYGDCQIRYAALPDAGEPASFYATVSLDPLTVAPLNLGTMAYGSASSARNIIIRNIDSNVVTLPENAVQISDTEHFTLTAPAGGSSVPAVSNDTPGVNQAWTLAPKADIPAGSYIITVTVNYSHKSEDYTTSANVYLTVTKADWDVSNIEVGVMAQTVLENSFTVTVSGVPTGARLSFQAGSGEWSAPEEHGIGGIYTHSFTELKPATSYPVHVHVEADANHNATTLRNADTGHTAQAKPVAAEVLHIDYGAETLRFASGYSTADYRVYLQGLGGDPDVELFNLDSLTERADAGFTLYVERRAQEPYRVSVPDFLVVAARAAAPTDITTTRASDDRSADGTIALGGLFQYRASRNGADLTNGWTSGYDLVRLSAGRYEVRRPPTDTAFASRIETVTIESAKPVVILRTRTYLPAGAGAGNEVVPSYLMMPAGWTPSTDPAQAGRYDRAYLTSPLDLPPASEIKSASHVFLGWYGSYEGAPTEVQTQTPTDNPIVSGYEYRAKWAIRPSVSTVAGAEPERDPQSVLAGLAQGDPVKLTVELPADKNTLALADIVLAGQSTGTAATLYSDAGFSQLVSDELPLTWAGEAGHPTRAWLKTVSADDTSVQIYYELTLKTTRKVSFTAVQEGGTAGSEPGKGVKTSSSILITFDDNVEFADGLSLSGEGVPAADAGVVLADGSGHALAGKLSDAGDEDKATYRLALSDVAAGDVILSIADWAGYDVDNGIGAGSTEEPQPQSARVALYRDATPPTATVTVAGNPFTEFLNAITFGLFFNETVDVSIAAADTGGDGVASVEYLKLSADTAEGEVVGFADADAAKAATDWAAYTPFSVEPNEKFIVYARVTDNAGNISVVGSDGVVVYTQSAAVTGTLHYTRLSGEDALAQLRLKGNTVAGVALVGEGAEGSDLALEEGTDYTVSALEAGGDEPPAADATLTLKAAWLEDRAAGNYQLEVSYKPLGEDYDEAAAATPENDAPETSMIALEVHKVTPEITLAAEPADGTAYATNNVTLRAFVADPGPNAGGDGRALPSGTVTFYKDGLEPTNRLNSEPLSIGEGGTTNPGQRRARLDITLETGTHQLYAVYTGDENYAGNSTGSPAIIENYEVEPAEQGTLMVREGAADGNLVTNTLDKRREDRSFKLYVSGGAVGNYIWASNNAGVAEIASSAAVAEPATPAGVEATITIKAAGSATLTVYREGDTNHNDSAAYTITLTVAEESTRPIPGGAVIGEGKPDAAVSVYGQPTTNAVTLKWDEATDKNTFTADDDLVYYVYYSTDATNDISTPEDCVANGTLLNGDAGGHYNLGSFAVTELEPNTAYWFNVVVEDEAENRAAYKAVRAVTRLDVNLSTAAQQGGKNGRNATSGILITFDQAVTGLTSDSVTVSGALVKAGAVTPVYSVEDNQDAGALSPTASWLVPVALVSGAVNGDKAQISVASWTNSGAQGDGHGYNVTNSATSFEVTAYKPVQQPTPTAYIDYENMWIRGLVPGGTYAFATTDTPFGGERTIDLSGDLMGAYPIPFGRFDTQLSIKRIGVPAGELPGLDDDDEGYLDSEVQTFAVPARPVAPSVNVASPTTPGGKGSVEVSGLAAGTSADLTTMAEFLAHNPQEDGYDDTMWTHSTPAGSDGKVTFSDLAPGAYYVRAKAKQPAGTYTGTGVGGLFPSPATFFLVYNPDETGLGSVLEGYSVDDGEAESVTNAHSIAITAPEAEEGHTTHAITGVSWVDADGNPASDPQNTNLDVNGYFIISGNAGTNFAIAPVPNLRPDDDFSPKTYTARLKVDYAITVIDDTGDDTTATFYRDITFTVHPHAAFAADDGAVLSSVDTNDTPEVEDDEEIPGGLTNTLTLTFAYPTYLEYANVVVGGAVTKTSSATGFRSVSVDQTTYVLDVTVNTASKTGDPASVTIPLDRNNHYYAEQVKAFGNEIHTQTDGVKIPRALKSAQAMAAVPGQATGIIQFELDDDYTPLNPADALLWSSGSPYTGPIELASAGDAGGAATIASVYRIEAGRDGQGNYWIFRAFITTTEAGPITLAIPSFDIGPIEVEGDLATGSVLGGAAYFLNHEGYNFYSNLDAFQVLNPVDAERGYVVPAIELPTSLEYTAGMNAEVYAWGPDGGDPVELEAGIHYTLSGGGPATFRFTETPGAYQSLANQLVLTLKEDWTHLPMTGGDPALNTRANGSYRLACVFGADEGGAGGAAAQAIFTIGDITPTYKLTVSDAPGGAGATARSERGWPTNTPTSEGYFAEGATVTLSAGTPEDGWRFASWLHTGGVTPVLPTEATGSITMLANELSVEAIYTDGTPPVTTIAPAPATEPGSYTWLNADSELTLTATDWDVETGAAGTVATIHYSIDSGQEQNYTVPFSLGADLAEGLHIIRYWSVDSKGNQESPKTATFGFDKTAPTATLHLRGVAYTAFNASEGFTRFYRGELPVQITKSDNPGSSGGPGPQSDLRSSGVAKVEYLLSTTAYADVAALPLEDGWIEDEDFTLNENWKGYIYARVTDKAGNVTVVRSDGIVRYTDAAAVTTIANFTKTSTVDVNASVILNGNSVAAITARLAATEQGQPDTLVKLVVGRDYTVDNGSGALSFMASWLEGLAAGAWVLTIDYAPGGVSFNPVP
ncbi:MAG: hypothetical protein LBP28_08190, partial [Coriobacteriales bacterium]|nr:hypothetical protein [Coriobacteriales bacterium]